MTHNCIICKTPLTGKHDRRCSVCIKIAKEQNRMKQFCMNLMNATPEKISILSECHHDNVKKERHHPDYSEPFKVMLLCRSCHQAEHMRIKDSGEATPIYRPFPPKEEYDKKYVELKAKRKKRDEDYNNKREAAKAEGVDLMTYLRMREMANFNQLFAQD